MFIYIYREIITKKLFILLYVILVFIDFWLEKNNITNFNTESKHISFSSSLIQLPAENSKQNKVKKFSSVFIESFKKNSKSLEQLNIFNLKSINFYYFSYLLYNLIRLVTYILLETL